MSERPDSYTALTPKEIQVIRNALRIAIEALFAGTELEDAAEFNRMVESIYRKLDVMGRAHV